MYWWRDVLLHGVFGPHITERQVFCCADNPLGLRIGLTFAAVSQLTTQILGMYELLKKRNFKMHAYYMRMSLLFCCFIPAIMRLPQLTGLGDGDIMQAIGWVFSFPLFLLNERAEKTQKWY